MNIKYFTLVLLLIFAGIYTINSRADEISVSFDYTVEQDTTAGNNKIEISAYPNPCDEHLNFKFKLDETNYIKLKIYDFNGNHIKTVIDGVQYSADTEYVITYNSSRLASGAYEYMLQSGDKYKAGKFVVQR